MNSIYNNPFRILGLPITASEREIAKQVNTLNTYAEMGKTKSFENDFSFLPTITRDTASIEIAAKKIEQSEDKFLNSLMWFWKDNTTDELVFDLVKDGNLQKAISIWEKISFVNKKISYARNVYIENLISYSNGWSAQKNDEHELIKDGEQYTIYRKKNESYTIPTALVNNFDFEGNWDIECDTEWIEGEGAGWSYGIVFGRGTNDETGSYYFFGINSTGHYMFAKYVKWGFTSIVDWAANSEILNKGFNRLRIEKREQKLLLYVNGIKLTEVTAEPFFGNKFGFKVTQNQKVVFSNFKFTKYSVDDSYGKGLVITSKNFSSIKNLWNLNLALSFYSNDFNFNKEYFKKANLFAAYIFNSEAIIDYAKKIAGEKYILNLEKAVIFYLTELIEHTKQYFDKPNGIKISEFISCLSDFPIEGKQFLISKFVSKQIVNIDKEIEFSKKNRKNSPSESSDFGLKLIENTISDLSYLEEILGKEDYQYQTISDKLSNEIVDCGIYSFNSCKNTNGEIDYSRAIIKEEQFIAAYEYALKIATTQLTKDRAQENLSSCKKFLEDKEYYVCWFCGVDMPDKTCSYYRTIYRVNNRAYKSVNYSYLPIEIPRCEKCNKIHENAKNKVIFSVVGVVITSLLLGSVSDFNIGEFWPQTVMFGGVLGFLLGLFLKYKEIKKHKVKSTSQYSINKYPPLIKMLNEGWQFSKPNAYF